MTDAVVSVCPSKTGPLDEVEREFGEPVVVPLPTGAEAAPGCGPNPQLDLFFADMTGDGLPDLVRVRRGTVEYWPSLGNGRFGERVVMGGAPAIPTTTGFDSARVRLIDLDGSGTADVLYLDDGRLWHFPNLGGRQLGARREIGALPTFDGRSAAIADLAGDGRPSLLWSATSPTRGHALSYLPLVPPTPPGMLIAIDDGCGRRTELAWGNSATHYLRDAADGVPWETRLPSHRPVIDARVELDLIGGTSVTTRYRYRDGYFDGAGGAFRGFGRVETLDVPQALPRIGGGLGDGGAPGDASEEPAFAPPLMTRTWFHLGTAMWNHHRPFEPYDGDPLLPPIGPHVEAPGAHLPADAAAALRLLAGSVVRRERWAVDAAEAPVAHPFDVEQASYQLVLSQPRRGAQRPVFGVVPRVRRIASYEGQGGDPRVTEELVLAHDVWGAPTRTAQVAYARRGAVDDAAQARTWVTVTDSGRADVDVDGQFLLGVELEASQRELVGVSPVGGRLGVEALTAPAVVAALAAPAPFEQALDPAATAPAARRLSWQRTYYWDAARAAEAPFSVVPKAPRVHHAEVACLTPALVAATLDTRIDDAGLAALGYVLADGHWWQRGPVQEVGGPFGLVTRTVRGDGATAEQVYDDDQLVVTAQIDALGLSTTSLIDYRVMAPARTTDPNGTTRSAVHDGFGRVIASGVEGHVGAQPWMSGTAIGWAAGAATVASVLADPAGYLADAATATFIDDRAWARDATPVAEVTVARRALVDDGAGGGAASGPLEVRVRYLDGFGRVLQEKVRVEAGPAIQRDVGGAVIVDAGGRPVLAPATERWQVSGHVVYDAKGQPGRVYEPYFSPSAAYEGDAVLARFGVSTLTTYDALGRPVRVDLPNGTYATTAHGAWATTAATPGDTVLDSTYRVVREGRPVDDAERVAYEHAAGHAGTPTVTYVDARGVACATRAVGDASAGDAWTRQVLDATGQARAVVDARGLTAFTYARDLRGRVVAQASVDAGPTWALADAYDRPVWTWDGRGFAVTRGFDVADRPTTVSVTGGDGAAAMDAMVEMYRYGDEDADRTAAVAANTVGRLVEVKDGAGVVAVTAYDPLGAVRAQGRRLRATVDEAPDWRGAEAVESEVLTTAARTDALGREVWTALADGTTRETVYARGGALVEVRVTTPDGALVEAPIVADVARDAHGRVVAATLGNGVGQTWAYDPARGRLVAQDAVRGTRAYQGLRCTYDPDGKLVRMLDVAQDGPGALVPGAVSARRDFGYDAHGRLVEATGRVHQALLPHDGPTTAGCVHGARHLSLNNGAALERYTQRFTYDAGGNLTRVQHAGTTASWATDYWVAAGSNRSTAAEDGNGVPVVNPAGMFDASGNLRELWHLRALGWSWRGCLTHATTVVRASGPVDDGERYAYGADRVRVRKVATRLVVGGAEPVVETREVVYCGGGHERVRVARNGTLVLERWTTHVGDGDRRVAVIDRQVIDTLANEVDVIGPARVRYHLTTPQGSTAVELDEAGLLVSYEEYLPHGGSAFIAGDDVREVARRDVRYAGKERDRATGLDAYPQRYYAPWLGRWLSPDPIGPKDGLNLYALVGGDPVGYVDPEGTEKHKRGEPPLAPAPVQYAEQPQATADWKPDFSEHAPAPGTQGTSMRTSGAGSASADPATERLEKSNAAWNEFIEDYNDAYAGGTNYLEAEAAGAADGSVWLWNETRQKFVVRTPDGTGAWHLKMGDTIEGITYLDGGSAPAGIVGRAVKLLTGGVAFQSELDGGAVQQIQVWPSLGLSEVSITANGDTYHILRDPSGQVKRDVEMTWPASGERVRYEPSSTAVFEDMFGGSMRWQANPEMVADYYYRMEVAKWTGSLRGFSGGAGLMLGAPRIAAQAYMESALAALGTLASGANAYEQYRAGNYIDAGFSALGAGLGAAGTWGAVRSARAMAREEAATLRSGSARGAAGAAEQATETGTATAEAAAGLQQIDAEVGQSGAAPVTAADRPLSASANATPVLEPSTAGAPDANPRDVYNSLYETERMFVQEEVHSCGAACARRLLADKGVVASEAELRAIGYDPTNGMFADKVAENMNRVLEARGLPARVQGGWDPSFLPVTNPFDDPRGFVRAAFKGTRGRPFIAQQGKHFVVAEGIQGDLVNLLDPWGLAGPGSPMGLSAKIDAARFVAGWKNGFFGIIIWR